MHTHVTPPEAAVQLTIGAYLVLRHGPGVMANCRQQCTITNEQDVHYFTNMPGSGKTFTIQYMVPSFKRACPSMCNHGRCPH